MQRWWNRCFFGSHALLQARVLHANLPSSPLNMTTDRALLALRCKNVVCLGSSNGTFFFSSKTPTGIHFVNPARLPANVAAYPVFVCFFYPLASSTFRCSRAASSPQRGAGSVVDIHRKIPQRDWLLCIFWALVSLYLLKIFEIRESFSRP